MPLSAKATQEFVTIKEVRDGIVILKDGGMRAVLLASSISIALKSQEEQEGIIAQFQAMLNSLDFSIQIVIQSRKLDIRPYLILLEEREKANTEQLLKIQTREYIDFIRTFTEERNIMTKNFFVVIPFNDAIITNSKGMFGNLFGGGSKKSGDKAKDDMVEFEEKRSQLEERVNVVQQGLARLGVRSALLGTEEVIELFYKVFNPGESESSIKLEESSQ